MSIQKVGSIKILKSDKDNYNLWKKKMDLFIKTTNSKYFEILDKGPFVSMKIFFWKCRRWRRDSSRAYPKGPIKIY